MAKRFYIDTSAYLCVLLGERGHKRLVKDLSGARLCSSVLLVLETNRNLIRLSREKLLSPVELQAGLERVQADLESFELRDLTLDLCTGLTMPVVSTPRSLDLGHLRTALWFQASSSLHRFVTTDARQLQAAREIGLPI